MSHAGVDCTRRLVKRELLLGVVVSTVLLAQPVRADTCGDNTPPFDDVAQNAGFCSDAVWARNANITLGCGDGTNFCPQDAVTRAQMALFVRRFAESTFPVHRTSESTALPAGDLDTTGLDACTTTPIVLDAGANLSFAHLEAVVSMQGGASAADVEVSITFIRDGAPVGPGHLVNPVTTVPVGQWIHASVIGGFRPVFPGTSNAWRVHVARAPGSATAGELAGLRCQLKVVSIGAPIPPF
jgi:hypothetical protein